MLNYHWCTVQTWRFWVYTRLRFLFFTLILSLYGISVRDICKKKKKSGPLYLLLTFNLCTWQHLWKKWAPFTCRIFAVFVRDIFLNKSGPFFCCLIAVFERDKICTKWGPFTCRLLAVLVRENICKNGGGVLYLLPNFNLCRWRHCENGAHLIFPYFQSLYVTTFLKRWARWLSAYSLDIFPYVSIVVLVLLKMTPAQTLTCKPPYCTYSSLCCVRLYRSTVLECYWYLHFRAVPHTKTQPSGLKNPFC